MKAQQHLQARANQLALYFFAPGEHLQGNPMRILFALQIFSTAAMFGLIWFVQIVHYPLFLAVGPNHFAAYEAAHANRTTYVVVPLMIVELVTAMAMLAPRLRPPFISEPAAYLGAALVGVVWLSTALVQVPLHNRLSTGYSAEAIARLVATNWVRTAAWTARAALLFGWALELNLV